VFAKSQAGWPPIKCLARQGGTALVFNCITIYIVLKGYIEAKLHYDQSKEASLTVEQRIDIAGDFRAGAAASLGFAASALVFGVIFGAASVTQGIPGLQSIAMSALVFAGTAQFAALELWHDPLPIAAIAVSTAFLITFLV
jgi:hypothetical protein